MTDNQTQNLKLNKSPESNYDYLSHNYKELLDQNWDKLDNILAHREVNVQQFGALGDGKNYTKEIQDAIDSMKDEGGILYVPPGVYLIDTWAEGSETDFPLGGISLVSNMVLYMAPGAVFQAIPNNHPDYTIVRITGQKNVAVYGGGFIGDRTQHLGDTGQWGFGISVIGSQFVNIEDCGITNCWGDGIFIGPNKEIGTESMNVRVRNVALDNNRRQGISVVGCIGAQIELCVITRTNGQSPEAGIDLEPANPSRIVKDIIIDGCNFAYNSGSGVQVCLGAESAVVKNNVVRNNQNGIHVEQSNNNRILGNTVEQNTIDGIYLEESHYNFVENNLCRRNGEYGIAVGKSNNNLVSNNICVENGQETDNIFDNISLWEGSSYNSIQSNMVRKCFSDESNKTRYGINISSSDCTSNFVVNNDLYDGGQTAEFHDVGTSTIENANRKTQGDYSIGAKYIQISDSNNLITAMDVDAAMDEIFQKLKNHIDQTIDSHNASSISIDDIGGHTDRTNVEDVIQELYDLIKQARTYAP